MGQEGYAATVKLLEVAEAAQAQALAESPEAGGSNQEDPIAWRK
jgi:hypothetical protein